MERFRVLAPLAADDSTAYTFLRIVDTDDPAEAYEPVPVRTDEPVEPGTLVAATLDWETGGPAAVDRLDVERADRYRFADRVTGLFDAARELWRDTRAAGDAMGSRVTRDTDGSANGALYVFADSGARDLFEEFRTGRTPLEPLVERFDEADSQREASGATDSNITTGGLTARLGPVEADEDGDTTDDAELPADESETATDADDRPADAGPTPRGVYVLRSADEPFVVVYVVRQRDGLLARTLEDTYF